MPCDSGPLLILRPALAFQRKLGFSVKGLERPRPTCWDFGVPSKSGVLGLDQIETHLPPLAPSKPLPFINLTSPTYSLVALGCAAPSSFFSQPDWPSSPPFLLKFNFSPLLFSNNPRLPNCQLPGSLESIPFCVPFALPLLWPFQSSRRRRCHLCLSNPNPWTPVVSRTTSIVNIRFPSVPPIAVTQQYRLPAGSEHLGFHPKG